MDRRGAAVSLPWMRWYPADWRSDPRLRMCSLSARGLWIELIGLMHEATPYGHLLVSGVRPNNAQIASLVGAPEEQVVQAMAELSSAGVFSTNKDGVVYSRRMTRDHKKAATARKNGQNGGNPTLSKEKEKPASDNPPVKGHDKPQRPEARNQNTPHSPPRGVDLMRDFAEWYTAYPRHIARGAAERAYKAARKHATADELLAGAKAFASLCQAKGTEKGFIAHPATWLNGRRWLDEDLAEAVGTAPQAEGGERDTWRSRLRAYRDRKFWMEASFGPRPGQPGCQAPPDLVAEILKEAA